MSTEMCEHHKPKKLDYVQWHEWAEEMERQGMRSQQCNRCKLWFYPEEFGHRASWSRMRNRKLKETKATQ